MKWYYICGIVLFSGMIAAIGTREIYRHYAARMESADRERAQHLVKALRGDIDIERAQREQKAASEARAQRRAEHQEAEDEDGDSGQLERLLKSVIP